jgi:hypothetical protein
MPSPHRKAGGLPNLRTLKGSNKCSRGLSEWAKPPEPNNPQPHILDFKTVLVHINFRLCPIMNIAHPIFTPLGPPPAGAWKSVRKCCLTHCLTRLFPYNCRAK